MLKFSFTGVHSVIPIGEGLNHKNFDTPSYDFDPVLQSKSKGVTVGCRTDINNVPLVVLSGVYQKDTPCRTRGRGGGDSFSHCFPIFIRF